MTWSQVAIPGSREQLGAASLPNNGLGRESGRWPPHTALAESLIEAAPFCRPAAVQDACEASASSLVHAAAIPDRSLHRQCRAVVPYPGR